MVGAGTSAEYFGRLGAAVSALWDGHGRAVSRLPEVAVQGLLEVPPPSGLLANDIMADFVGATDLPVQSSADDQFGQPPLVLHREDDFFIQALIWMEGTTAIHEHGFAGAFMVLDGMSLHVEQEFEAAATLGDHRLAVGRLRLGEPEILHPGMVRAIEPGGDFIHALFHLERPTVTIVVRNTTCGLDRPQYSYRPPGLAFDGLWSDRVWVKKMQSVDSLARLDRDRAQGLALEMVSGASLWEAWSMVDHWSYKHGWDHFGSDLAAVLDGRTRDWADLLIPAMEHDATVRRILLRRGMLRERHQRLLLALLANLPDPAATVSVIGHLYPDQEPADLLLEWAGELSSPALRGISGLALSAEKLSELAALPAQERERRILSDIRSAWGEPEETLTKLLA